MDYFNYQDGKLYAEGLALDTIAEKYGTPCYVYSHATFVRHFKAFDSALKQHAHLVCYAVKANSNIALLNLLAKLGAGFDIVSGGELARVLKAGGDPQKTVFSGVGKTAAEIEFALKQNILCFNVESEAELERINTIAEQLQLIAPISIRVNPDVDAKSHPYISTGSKDNKFGIDIQYAEQVYLKAAKLPHLKILGLDCHIGSQITDLNPFLEALDRLLVLMKKLKHHGIELHHLDLGGGLAAPYNNEKFPEPAEYAAAIDKALGDHKLTLIIEPGRAIAANAGILLTRVEYLKHTEHKNFAIVDAAMNDLLRPSLYQAWHTILPVAPRTDLSEKIYDVVGPVCETGDILGPARSLALAENDLLAIRSAGAYGFSMSSNYNSRPRAAEVLVHDDKDFLIRQRESYDDLFALEQIV